MRAKTNKKTPRIAFGNSGVECEAYLLRAAQ